MREKLRFLGMDVHAETIAVAIAEPDGEVRSFHMDEYIGLPSQHPASFRGYLHARLTEKVPLSEFSEVDGTAPDAKAFSLKYAATLRAAEPQLCLMGIGENGHPAFNDPGVVDFNDPVDVKVVHLDRQCREQQAAEGWFAIPLRFLSQQSLSRSRRFCVCRDFLCQFLEAARPTLCDAV